METPTVTLHEMQVMDGTGDSRTAWDPNDPTSVEIAKAAYDKAIAKGYKAFRVDPKDVNKPGELLTAWDPKVEAMILAPRMVGG